MAADTTARGQLRLLIADTGTTSILTDDEVDGFLALHGVTNPTDPGASLVAVKRAAADALDAIASSEALVSKKVRTQAGVSTDGPAVAAALRAHASQLRAQADTAEADAAPVFEVAEFTPWPTTVL